MTHIRPILFTGLRSAVAVIALLPFVILEQKKTKHRIEGLGSFAMLGGLVFFLAAAIQQVEIVTATVTNTVFLQRSWNE